MKIIQSYYQIDTNICYYYGTGNDNYLINFYSLLLSYLTVKEFYGEPTMYCNELAYDKILKFIPYEDLIIDTFNDINTDNYSKEWGLLKFNVFRKQLEPFIHIDCDVFLFKDVLSEFINNESYDGVVQSVEIDDELYGKFYRSNVDKLSEHGIIDIDKAKASQDKYKAYVGYNNGVVGIRNMEFLDYYINTAFKINDLINDGTFIDVCNQTVTFEQFNIYHSALKKNMKFYEVLPYDLIKEIGSAEVGNKVGYTHLLSGNKYVGHFIMLVRNKIISKYPEYTKYIEQFEDSIVNANIQFLEHADIDKFIKKV